MVYRTASPMLRGEDMLYECPVGKVIRETPYLFDAIMAHGFAESGGFDFLGATPWLRAAFRVIGSEKERHRLAEDAERQARRDAGHARAVLTRR